jgi:hypothetical protein
MVGLVLVSSVLSLWLVRGDMRIFLRRQGSCRGHNNLSQSQGAGRDAAILVGRIAVTEVLGTGGASAARHGATVGSCPYVPLPTEAAASSPSLSDMWTCHWCNAPSWEATVDVGGSRSDEGWPRRRARKRRGMRWQSNRRRRGLRQRRHRASRSRRNQVGQVSWARQTNSRSCPSRWLFPAALGIVYHSASVRPCVPTADPRQFDHDIAPLIEFLSGL